jgi:hypothetical protein
MRMLEPEISPTQARDHHDEEPGPCRGCVNFFRCARERLACAQFAGFVRHNRRWPSASRLPLAKVFHSVMSA